MATKLIKQPRKEPEIVWLLQLLFKFLPDAPSFGYWFSKTPISGIWLWEYNWLHFRKIQFIVFHKFFFCVCPYDLAYEYFIHTAHSQPLRRNHSAAGYWVRQPDAYVDVRQVDGSRSQRTTLARQSPACPLFQKNPLSMLPHIELASWQITISGIITAQGCKTHLSQSSFLPVSWNGSDTGESDPDG